MFSQFFTELEKFIPAELVKSINVADIQNYAQNGIGSNSCGPKLRKQYCFQKEQFVCEWKLMFEEKSEKLSGNDCFCKEGKTASRN